MRFTIVKPLKFRFKPRAVALRRSGRLAVVKVVPLPVSEAPPEEIRGVAVKTLPSGIVVVSEATYSTYRYRDLLKAAGGIWNAEEKAWRLPAGTNVKVALTPPPAPRPSWVCCEKASILSHKSQHYSCQEHTMYWEDCKDALGNPIKILYATSTMGGGCYTGT